MTLEISSNPDRLNRIAHGKRLGHPGGAFAEIIEDGQLNRKNLKVSLDFLALLKMTTNPDYSPFMAGLVVNLSKSSEVRRGQLGFYLPGVS